MLYSNKFLLVDIKLILYIYILIIFLTNKTLSLGDKLTLRCEIHNDWIKTVCDSSDFLKARCIKVCNMKMDCSHHCPQLCHYYDQSHETLYRCKQPYTK